MTGDWNAGWGNPPHSRYNLVTSWWFQPNCAKYLSTWIISPNKHEHKKNMKPPPRLISDIQSFYVHTWEAQTHISRTSFSVPIRLAEVWIFKRWQRVIIWWSFCTESPQSSSWRVGIEGGKPAVRGWLRLFFVCRNLQELWRRQWRVAHWSGSMGSNGKTAPHVNGRMCFAMVNHTNWVFEEGRWFPFPSSNNQLTIPTLQGSQRIPSQRHFWVYGFSQGGTC